MSKPKLSKPTKQPSELVKSLPSKIPYIYPYRLPSGEVRYRVRIRKKTFAGRPLEAPINEVYHTLDDAKKALHDLEFGDKLAKMAEYKLIIQEGSAITIRELVDEFYRKRLADGLSGKYYKSKITVIKRTEIETDDTRITRVANFSFTANAIIKNEKMQFGDFRVNNFDVSLLNRYVETRLKSVKPQTVANEVVVINNALKDGHNLFTSLKRLEEPLKDFAWKQLEAEVTYRDKRIRPEHKKFMEELLLKRSRNNHYNNLYIFLYETGCRISEALSIKVKDIDFNQRTIFVITKKNKRPRYLGMSPILYPLIVERAKDKQPNDRIFSYTVDTYESKLTRLRKTIVDAGIKFTWHDLRHNYISKHVNSKNVLQIMHEMDINDMQYFQNQYLSVVQSEQAAIKVANSEKLTAQDVANTVGHFGNLEQTQEYTHHSPEFLEVKPNLLEILKQQQEQLKKQQEQIEQLLQKQNM